MAYIVTSENTPKQRLVHLDACRGFVMLLVIYWHIIESFGRNTELCVVFSLFHNPTFLAISGYCAFTLYYDASKAYQKSWDRVIKQLYPTIFLWWSCVVLTSIYQGNSVPSFLEMLCDPFKRGYWFTFALVELFFIALPLLMFFNKRKYGRGGITVILAVVALLFSVSEVPLNELIERYWFLDIVGNALNLKVVIGSGFCFFLGMIAKVHHQSLERLGNKWVALMGTLLCFAVFSRVYFVVADGSIHRIAHYFSAISGMLALYCIFLKLAAVKNALMQKIMHWFTVVGKRTLEIYLLHWFVLLFAQPLVVDCGLENVLNTWYEFPVVFTIAIAIAITILSFVKLLKLIGIYEIFFPQSTDKVLAFVNACRMKLRLSNPV